MTTSVIDRGEIRQLLQDFSSHWAERTARWRVDGTAHTEKSFAQSFWSDLLTCFGINAARRDLFERDAKRATTGNTGYIDVFQSGVFIGEAKSIGADLDDAHRQALDYLAGGSIGDHEFPRFVVVTDFGRIRVDALGDETWTAEFSVAETTDHLDELLFLAGRESITKAEELDANKDAASLMASLYAAMVGTEADEKVGDEAPTNAEEEDLEVQHASMFLTRILFLLYGDDAGLWEADLFYRWVDQTTSADTLGGQLVTLFQILNTPAEKRPPNLPDLISRFPYVNGALFADPMPADFFTREMREALLSACRFRWTRISPAVFGAMFQLVKSRTARRRAGEHYTSEENILKTIGPLFLDDYRDRADRLIANKSTTGPQLTAFQEELAANVYVDPACGSGNFLNLAYAKLREIETDIIVERRRRFGQTGMSLDATLEQKLTIDRFHGFEINWWPAKIAETAMFLVDHQANRRLAEAVGQAPDRLPIQITAHIVHCNALEQDWAYVLPKPTSNYGRTFLFGNPPFLGHDSRTKEQAAELRKVWRTKSIGRLDYVTGWHAKSLDALAQRDGEFAYVATNSISQGDQVPRLFGPIKKEGWRIKFAHRTFAWDSQAPGKAAVHCVIVGYTRDEDVVPRLWNYATPQSPAQEVKVSGLINAYLVDGPDILIKATRKQLNPSIPRATFGSTPRANDHLTVTEEQYNEVMADPVAAKYVRPFIGAEELLHNKQRWCLWMVDLDPADISRSPLLKARLAAVKKWREESDSEDANAAAATPHLFWWRSQPDQPYLCIPSAISNSRPFFIAAPQSPEVIASNLAFTVPDPDGFAFALVSSSMFLTWQRATGGRLKSDVRFSSSLTWNNFPLPDVDGSTRTEICAAGAKILSTRAKYPELTLAEAYHPLGMKPELISAHHELDSIVDRTFGAASRVTTEKKRLEILMNSYAELTGTLPLAPARETLSPLSRAKKKNMSETAIIRQWARTNGHTVSDRGKLSKDLIRAYRAQAT